MTFKDLQKAVQSQQSGPELNTIPGDKPFWIWDQQQHKQEDIRTKGQCCFWHVIKPPQKDGRDMPVLPYQKTLYDALQNHKHIWCLKSRGIGVTTFFLRYIAWSCLSHFGTNDRVCIITGPRIDLAEDLIARFKALFVPQNGTSDRTQSTVAFLNGIKVEAFPSHHVSTMRGLDNVKFIMSDESDMYPVFQQREVRAVMKGYIGKPNSNPTIILVSTPNAPNGLMQQIETEQDSLYHKLAFDYRHGLEGPYPIYSQDQIDIARLSPEFPREFENQYLGQVGNCFSQASIQKATELPYNSGVIWPNVKKSVGIDVGWGSSMFSIVVTQFVNNHIEVVIGDLFERPSFQSMVDEVWKLKQRCGYISNIYVDSSAPSYINALKTQFEESTDWHYIHERMRWHEEHGTRIENEMLIIPVSFGKYGAEMLQRASAILDQRDEEGNSVIAIDKNKFPRLIPSLRTAQAENYKLNKELSSFHDLTDSFRLSLRLYARSK